MRGEHPNRRFAVGYPDARPACLWDAATVHLRQAIVHEALRFLIECLAREDVGAAALAALEASGVRRRTAAEAMTADDTEVEAFVAWLADHRRMLDQARGNLDRAMAETSRSRAALAVARATLAAAEAAHLACDRSGRHAKDEPLLRTIRPADQFSMDW